MMYIVSSLAGDTYYCIIIFMDILYYTYDDI